MKTPQPREWLVIPQEFGRDPGAEWKTLDSAPRNGDAVERDMAQFQHDVACHFLKRRGIQGMRSWEAVAKATEYAISGQQIAAVMRGQRNLTMRMLAVLSLELGRPYAAGQHLSALVNEVADLGGKVPVPGELRHRASGSAFKFPSPGV